MTRPRPLAATIVAAGVFATLVVILVVRTAVGALGVSGPVGDIWTGIGQEIGLVELPFAVGVLLSLGRLLPVTSTMSAGAAVVRGLVAAVVGAVLVVIVGLVIGYVVVPGGGSPLPFIAGGVGVAVQAVPLAVLAAVLLWTWLRAHLLEDV